MKFVSVKPPANYDGFRIDTPLNLKGVQEIFFTVEGTDGRSEKSRPALPDFGADPGGQDVVHFDLVKADPALTASGTAALLVDLDQDPVQF